jgi:DNA ligase-1
MEFPTLFSITKLKKIKIWNISVVNKNNSEALIKISTGFIDGKMTNYDLTITSGKNIGRSNETSVYDQAVSRAQSKWNNKKENGYTENYEGVSDKILPMLALDYKVRHSDIIFPCFVQPKIDGVRAIYNNGDMYSRTGKKFNFLDHIIDEIKSFYPEAKYLDGELFSDELTFQEISGIVRRSKNRDLVNNNKIHYIVYDLVSDKDYKERIKEINENIGNNKNFKYVYAIKHNQIAYKSSEIEDFHEKYVSLGYEGLIIRNFKGKYLVKNRSKDLQKYKKFIDEEFKIVSFTQGEGIEAGLVIWICETNDDNKTLFHVRPKGCHSERRDMFLNSSNFLGKMLTVKYFEMTDPPNPVPRFPIGVSIRDYE